ncbi:MAG TPA: GntR family transcriptional regulator, partial [Hyphomicrobiales bacterium]
MTNAAVIEGADEGQGVGETTYRRIQTDILFGRLAPGQKLKLERMREAYGVSISTLRELLSRLATEGLIVAEGLRGFEVTPVSAADLREIAELRLLLEGFALRLSFESGDLEWEGRVVSAHHKLSILERRMAGGDASQTQLWKHYDREFHHALISACDSTALLETHASVYNKYLRYQMVTMIFRGEIAAREHRALLDCALERNWRT